MSYILDGIIVLIIAVTVFISAKKGFVRTLIEVIGLVAAIVVAFSFSTPVADTVYNKFIEPKIISTVENSVNDTANSAADTIDTVWNELPKFITNNNFLGVSKENVYEQIKTDTSDSTSDLAVSVSNSFVKPAAVKFISLIFSVISVVVLIFVTKFLAKYINKLFNFSIVGKINRTLGGIIGLFKGVAVAVVFCLIISLVMSFTESGFLIFTYDTVNSSYIFKFLMGFFPFI